MKAGLVMAGLAVCFGVALAFGVKLVGGWNDAEAPRAAGAPAVSTPRETTLSQATTAEGPSAPAPELSPAKARWLDQVNRLCRRGEAESERYADNPPRSRAEAKRWFRGVVRLNARYNDRFAALTPAREDRRAIAGLLDLVDREEGILQGMLAALESGDDGAFVELGARLTTIAQREIDILLALGADDCGGDLFAGAY